MMPDSSARFLEKWACSVDPPLISHLGKSDDHPWEIGSFSDDFQTGP